MTLQEQVAQKLVMRSSTLASTLYNHKLKTRGTPGGSTVPAIKASVRRLSESGWPTPNSTLVLAKPNVVIPKKTAKDPQVGLADVTNIVTAGWPTPQAFDSTGGGQPRPLRYKGTSASASTGLEKGWRSPSASDGEGGVMEIRDGANARYKLRDEAHLASGWPTPVANDDNKSPEAHLAMKQRMGERDGTGVSRTALNMAAARVSPTDFGAMLTGSPSVTGKSARLNPALSRWLMGIPPSWDDCAPMEMPSTRKSRKPS